jgi:DNA replication protein DnaC
MTHVTLDNYYEQIRSEEHEALSRRIDDAFSRAPRLKALDHARSQLFSDLGARKITAAEGKRRLEAISTEEQEILSSLGLSADALTLHVRCELCNDTGYVGPTHQPCACRLLYRERLRGSDGVNERETFPNFSEEIFPTAEQKKRTMNAKTICERYAKALPSPEKPNLLLLGMPGLGKSFLGNAIAYEALLRGVDAERVTAYAFVQAVLKDIRERTEHTQRYQRVPLLVLDDLGSEPIIPNVSFEWLFAVINERTLAGRATVCSSNLPLKQLSDFYDERFMSRLCDRNTTQVLRLTGENLRTI